jgi:hypothetical protein
VIAIRPIAASANNANVEGLGSIVMHMKACGAHRTAGALLIVRNADGNQRICCEGRV